MLVCVSIIRVSSVNMVDAGPPILGPIEPKKAWDIELSLREHPWSLEYIDILGHNNLFDQ
jgi:hypothetical protein